MKNARQDLTDARDTVTINDLLRVQIMDDPNPISYYSRINDISEGRLVIAWPTNRGIRLLIHRDQILELSFMRDCMPYSFTGLVDETNVEPLPQINIIMTSPVVRVQRRQNFRIKCLIPVEIHGSSKENPQAESIGTLSFRTSTYDISASGISIRHSRRIPEGALLDIKLDLPDGGPVIKAPCRVIYSENLAENQVMYRTGLHYLAVSESERARIVRYVYRTQLKGLRT